MAASSRHLDRSATYSSLAATIAGLLEEGSVRAAKAKSEADAEALRELGEQVAILAAAMTVLISPKT